MTYKHFFQWNIPADNQISGDTGRYIDVLASWNGDGYYSDGRPMVYIEPVNISFHDCWQVKDWSLAQGQIRAIAEKHFAEMARLQRLNKAREILINEGEPTGVPTLDLYEANLSTQ